MPLSAIWQHPPHQRLKERLRFAAPYLFTRRLDLSTRLTPQECVDILEAETSPIPKGCEMWGVKSVVAAFEPSRITLFRFKGGVYEFCPIYMDIEARPTGSVIHCWASMNAGTRLMLAFCYLFSFAFPLLLALGKPHLFQTKSDLIPFGIIVLGLPLMAWTLNRYVRKIYNEAVEFITQFLTENLKAVPLAESKHEILGRAAPLPSKTMEILLIVSAGGAGILATCAGSYALAHLIAWLPRPYDIVMIAALPFATVLGPAIVLIIRDPAFRKKSSSQDNRE